MPCDAYSYALSAESRDRFASSASLCEDYDINNYNSNLDIQISEYAKNLLNDLKREFDGDITVENIKDKFKLIFGKNMYSYLHSRLGTNLTEKELEEQNKITQPDGIGLCSHNNEICVALYTSDHNTYKVAKKTGDISSISKTELTKIAIQLSQPPKFGDPVRNDENLLEIYEIKDE